MWLITSLLAPEKAMYFSVSWLGNQLCYLLRSMKLSKRTTRRDLKFLVCLSLSSCAFAITTSKASPNICRFLLPDHARMNKYIRSIFEPNAQQSQPEAEHPSRAQSIPPAGVWMRMNNHSFKLLTCGVICYSSWITHIPTRMWKSDMSPKALLKSGDRRFKN